MDSHSDLLAAACREAGADLAIRVHAPFLATDPAGASIRFDALVCDLGWPRGTLLTPLNESPRQRQLAGDLGYNLCSLNTDILGTYARTDWIALMRGWIWVGEQAAPPWHRGRGWIAEPATVDTVRVELARIFGEDVEPEGSIPHLILPFAASEDVVAFVRSVPAGYSRSAVMRWATDLRDRLEPASGWP
jgi:hypothetical protein